MRFTRDSLLLWLGLIGAVIAHLLSVGDLPTHWTYQQWLQFATAMIAVGMAKLQASPLPSTREQQSDEFYTKGKFLIPLLLATALGLSGCASAGGARHIATVTVVSAHATLAAVQDTEMLLVCGKPTAPAPPLCVTAEVHREISAKLVTAFEADIAVATTIRDWPALEPQPTHIGALLGQMTVIVNAVLDSLPDGALKTKLLTIIGGAK